MKHIHHSIKNDEKKNKINTMTEKQNQGSNRLNPLMFTPQQKNQRKVTKFT
jgi:hypothetical protein